MAELNRFAHKNYATIEINRFSAPDTNRVLAQLPLSTDATTGFTDEAPCENGMWLVYDELAGVARKPTAVTEPVGLMYLNEKQYNPLITGINQWALKPNSYCPRVYFNAVHDAYTTNCFCYGNSLADEAAVTAALAADITVEANKLCLIPSVNGAPELVKASYSGVATASVVAQVIKVTTMPNGEKAIKVAFTKTV